ncbi:E3 ubiquitin-protein ligase IPI1-like isoform X2 [Amaranthus tricolor]|uniref:E3 ubiquitin-protein ligase IPI1-like isoform X2 n=1 Tax=Amaranthus tricolor TaxID=29722 RepID=UPI002583E7B4|nr:E3 ubiquitin-protein ligase IPI1-like isoform X2 [Amaranthus tricolor]
MGFDESEIIDDDGGGGKSLRKSNVACSICLEFVTDNGDRSWAKLQCGHEFHLDCIGSAFNIKGKMQCPNCRKIEKGEWLYATNCRSFTDYTDDWPPDEELYDFGVPWCPVPAFSRFPSFEEGDFSSVPYHDFLVQPAVFAEHTAVSSSTHQCPYMAYYGPVHSSSSNSVGSVSDGSNFSNRWGAPSGPSEMPTSYTFGATDPHHHGWEHHNLRFLANGSRLSASDQPSTPSLTTRSSRVNSDVQRSGLFVHPSVASHSSSGRVGSSIASSLVPPYPSSAARARDRAQALQAYFHQPSSPLPMRAPVIPNTRRSSGHLRLSQGPSLPSSSDQTSSSFFVYPSGLSTRSYPQAENQLSSRNQGWERDNLASFPLAQGDRDSIWLSHQIVGGSSSFRQRHGSERTQSQNRS